MFTQKLGRLDDAITWMQLHLVSVQTALEPVIRGDDCGAALLLLEGGHMTLLVVATALSVSLAYCSIMLTKARGKQMQQQMAPP